MNRKIMASLATMLLLLTCSFTVLADGFDKGRSGSISVTLNDQNEPLVDIGLSVYYVATVEADESGDLAYNFTDDFKSIHTSLDDPALAKKLNGYVSKNDLTSFEIKTDAKGKASCENLPLGLYFIRQTVVAEGSTACAPFLVTLPNEKDGVYTYAVNASPKTEVTSFISITIKKVWNTDKSTDIPDRVTVQLLENGNVVKTATLDQTNDWQITYADMPKSDAYSIKETDVPKGFAATYKQECYIFTVTNTTALIQTGQLMWPIPVLAISGMLLIAVGAVILLKKRAKNA